MSMLLIPDKNIFLGFCNNIQQICKPLEHLGVTFFNYVKIYKDGSRIDLSSHLDATEYYYFKNKGYENHALETNPEKLQSSFLLWKNSFADDPTVQVFREQFNIDNGAALIEKTANFSEIYYFASTKENFKILDFYFNNLNVLKLFIYYFKDKAAKIIKEAEANRIQTVKKLNFKNLKQINESLPSVNLNNYLCSLDIKRFYLGGSYNCYLTKREVECLNWCIKGKSAEEIAMILGCSANTAIAHLENIKKKLGCSKQIQIATAAYELGLNIG